MAKRVLDVGNCSLDHNNLKRLIESNFDATVSRTHVSADAISSLRSQTFDLVLVNRVLNRDDSEGLELIETIKADPQLSATPAMLISDFDHFQQQAMAAGAEMGFGKKSLASPQTRQRLARFLDNRSPATDSDHVRAE
jgi:two-component system, chemotaxis family, chemotaxis protein CheY